MQCSGETSRDLQVCNANNRWEAVDTCETATLCERSVSMAMADPTWTPQCLTPSCSAGSLKCEGSTLYRCRQSQDGYDRIDICASPALCQLAAESDGTGESMCPTGCTPAGSFRCTDNAVEQCASDQTGYVQPTKNELRKHRGVNSIYHNNGIQTWYVKADGVVENVEVS